MSTFVLPLKATATIPAAAKQGDVSYIINNLIQDIQIRDGKSRRKANLLSIITASPDAPFPKGKKLIAARMKAENGINAIELLVSEPHTPTIASRLIYADLEESIETTHQIAVQVSLAFCTGE